MSPKILMFFHGGSLNRGCEAIVRTAVDIIKTNIPDAKIDLASGNPETDKIIPNLDGIFEHKSRRLKRNSLESLISVFYIKGLGSESYALRKMQQDIIKRIPDYDVFLSIGGDNYCYGEQPEIYELDRCIKKAGKKLLLWGASVGEEDLSHAKIEDLKHFDLVLARETLTFNLLEDNGVDCVRLVADGAFTMDNEQLELPEGWQEGNTIGFNYSPLVLSKNKNSKEAAERLVEYILETTDMTIAFTPHVIEPGNDDYECLLEFYYKYKDSKKVLILPNNLNAIQYKGYIRRMRFFIGARTHATIAAYSSIVPTMVLGYSVKSKGIAKDLFGVEKFVLSLDEISDAEKLISNFNELLSQEDEIKNRLKDIMPDYKKMSIKAAEYLKELIS